MSDLFHPQVPSEFIGSVWDVMARADWHTFQVLTKRPQRLRELLTRLCDSHSGPLANVWAGTSIEADRYAWRADHLRATPAAVRWLSLEPLLSPLPSLDLSGIDWVVVGGESGPGARPMHPDWVRDIRDRCQAAGIPFLFKQWGAWRPLQTGEVFGQGNDMPVGQYGPPAALGTGVRAHMRRVGKNTAGRTLDGRTWDQFPEEATR